MAISSPRVVQSQRRDEGKDKSLLDILMKGIQLGSQIQAMNIRKKMLDMEQATAEMDLIWKAALEHAGGPGDYFNQEEVAKVVKPLFQKLGVSPENAGNLYEVYKNIEPTATQQAQIDWRIVLEEYTGKGMDELTGGVLPATTKGPRVSYPTETKVEKTVMKDVPTLEGVTSQDKEEIRNNLLPSLEFLYPEVKQEAYKGYEGPEPVHGVAVDRPSDNVPFELIVDKDGFVKGAQVKEELYKGSKENFDVAKKFFESEVRSMRERKVQLDTKNLYTSYREHMWGQIEGMLPASKTVMKKMDTIVTEKKVTWEEGEIGVYRKGEFVYNEEFLKAPKDRVLNVMKKEWGEGFEDSLYGQYVDNGGHSSKGKFFKTEEWREYITTYGVEAPTNVTPEKAVIYDSTVPAAIKPQLEDLEKTASLSKLYDAVPKKGEVKAGLVPTEAKVSGLPGMAYEKGAVKYPLPPGWRSWAESVEDANRDIGHRAKLWDASPKLRAATIRDVANRVRAYGGFEGLKKMVSPPELEIARLEAEMNMNVKRTEQQWKMFLMEMGLKKEDMKLREYITMLELQAKINGKALMDTKSATAAMASNWEQMEKIMKETGITIPVVNLQLFKSSWADLWKSNKSNFRAYCLNYHIALAAGRGETPNAMAKRLTNGGVEFAAELLGWEDYPFANLGVGAFEDETPAASEAVTNIYSSHFGDIK